MEHHNNILSSFAAFLQICIGHLRHSNPAECLTVGLTVLEAVDDSYRPQRNSEFALLPLWQIGFSG